MSKREWERHVATLCREAWQLGPFVTRKVIAGLEFLEALDQVSDFSVAEVLLHVGVDGAEADSAAPGIRARMKRAG